MLRQLANGDKKVSLTYDNQRGVFLKKGTTQVITQKEFYWTTRDLCQHLHCSPTFLHRQIRPYVHYVYFAFHKGTKLADRVKHSFLLSNSDNIDRVYLNTKDVFNWVKSNFVCGKKSYALRYNDVFPKDEKTKKAVWPLLEAANKYDRMSSELYKELKKYAYNPVLLEASAIHKGVKYIDSSSKWPFVPKKWKLTEREFKNADFKGYSSYDWPALAKRDLLEKAADVYLFKPVGSRNYAKTLFVLPDIKLDKKSLQDLIDNPPLGRMFVVPEIIAMGFDLG